MNTKTTKIMPTMQYQAEIEKFDDGYYVGSLKEIREIVVAGDSRNDVIRKLQTSLNVMITYHLNIPSDQLKDMINEPTNNKLNDE